MLKFIVLFLNIIPFEATDTLTEKNAQFYYKSQYAGNIGLISAGGGFDYREKNLFGDVSLGYLPKHINGVRVFTFSVKPAWEPFDFKLGEHEAGLYLGLAVNYSFGRNIFGSMPDYYPLDYYWPNAFRFNPFAGTRIGFNREKGRLHLYAELGTVDYKIWFALKNRNINLTDIANLGIGVMFTPFRH
jgi:hypothetical protein